MKLIFLLICGLGLLTSVAEKSYAQSTKLTFSLTGASIKNVLEHIEKSSEFSFMYENNVVDVNAKVDIEANSETIDVILNRILDESIEYRVVGRHIVLFASTQRLGESRLVQSQQQRSVSGKVTDSSGLPLPGVTIVIKGTTQGTVTNADGNYTITNIPEDATLVFSFVGMRTQDVIVENQTTINISMVEDVIGIEEVVAVGYGTMKKSDITGSIASIGQERMNMVPNINIAQAIQGVIPGVMMQTTSAGAASSQELIIRGRNSILANNNPLIVIDGITYSGTLNDINVSDVMSIEILKDASAAAIYGSRAANGVILITTKTGIEGKPKISYNGYYSFQSFINLPNMMNGEEFYEYKMERGAEFISPSEQEIYETGQWVDWIDLALRDGNSTDHNLSVSGGSNNTKYYISGGITKVRGLALNDDYLRLTSRINLNTKVTDWLTIGTSTQFSFDDRGGLAAQWSGDQGAFRMNPLTKAYDDNGNLTLYPWISDPYFGNPLQRTLATNTDIAHQLITNNYGIVNIPFIPGLDYRLNTGFRTRYRNINTYYGKNTKLGLESNGNASTNQLVENSSLIENIVNYNRELEKHALFFTAVYGYESEIRQSANVSMNQFPHDFITWYSSAQAGIITPTYSYNKTVIISQMLRLNYFYDSRYLLTVTGRRDGYSGFGIQTKWGTFPSIAAGWNLARENFFIWNEIINELKIRVSYGLNGNQAVGAYETISRLESSDYVEGKNTLAGYAPSKLGLDNLGWETSKTLNVGLDFGFISNRITGNIDFFKTNTYDLLLNRTISPIHGITSITQNIGKTNNLGFETSVTSVNIVKNDFIWQSDVNFSLNKNKIVSLYGELDLEGKEIDDVANKWFIGQPILVNYGYVWEGIWQLEEAEDAVLYGTQPGYIKVKDVNDDGVITEADRQIVGQNDPKFLWGVFNKLSYKNMSLTFFVHGVYGVTKSNILLLDDNINNQDTRRNVLNKIYWTQDNSDAINPINRHQSWLQNGIMPMSLQNANFIRFKDIILSYNLPESVLNRVGFKKLQLFVTGKNLLTITKWTGLDPELNQQHAIPLQKEYVLGLNFGF